MISRRKWVKQGLGFSAGMLLVTESGFAMSIFAKPKRQEGRLLFEIKAEEDIYSYVPADNGASPMWSRGATTIVRLNDKVYASGLETDLSIDGLSRCRWLLFERKSSGWLLAARDLLHLNREPCPVAVFDDGTLLLSVNPKQADTCKKYCLTHPEILAFKGASMHEAPDHWTPIWGNNPGFNDHSYRALAVDSANHGLILFQNYMYDLAEWSFRDRSGEWTYNGSIHWPVDIYNGKEVPLRLCYSNVALKGKKAWFLSTSDIVEPNEAWQEYKKELTGNEWDYVFRRMFFSYSENITSEEFQPWIEIANRDATAGKVWHQDLWIDGGDRAHILWTEQAIDERLRDRFFPDSTQYNALNYTVIHQGKIIKTVPLVSYSEGDSDDLAPGEARFHVTPDGRMFVFYYIRGKSASGEKVSENRIMEITQEGLPGQFRKIPFKKPFTNFQTATERAGCMPSEWIDVIGVREGQTNSISYGQIRLL